MTKPRKPNFNPEFRLKTTQLVIEQNHSVAEAAEAMGVGKSTMDKWVRQLRSKICGEAPKATPITDESCRIRELKSKLSALKWKKIF